MRGLLDSLRAQFGSYLLAATLSVAGAGATTWLNVHDFKIQLQTQAEEIHALQKDHSELSKEATERITELRVETGKLSTAVDRLTSEIQSLRQDIRDRR